MPTVTRKATNQMIYSILSDALEGTGILIFLPDESPPEHDPDKTGDTPATRWCKMHRADIRSASKQSETADERLAAMTLSVGVSAPLIDANRHQLDEDTQTVLEALEHASMTHSDMKHSINIFDADSDIETAGEHDGDGIGIITITASVRRIV
ncbi:hypothetical protein COB72_09255 [bacterium]|nr:MAG: hypothetical protein COB72_09255 [bacterium]